MRKRRGFAVFCIMLVVFGMLAACANKEDAEIAHMEWTIEDWNKEDLEARIACAITFENHARVYFGKEKLTDEDLEALTDEDKDVMQLLLGALLSISDGKTVRQILDGLEAQRE